MKQTKTMRNLSGFILHLHSCDILYKIAVRNKRAKCLHLTGSGVSFLLYLSSVYCSPDSEKEFNGAWGKREEGHRGEERRGEEVGDRWERVELPDSLMYEAVLQSAFFFN